MTSHEFSPIRVRLGLLAGALVISGCLNVHGDLGIFTEGGSDSSGGAGTDTVAGTSGDGATTTSGGADPSASDPTVVPTTAADTEEAPGELLCPENLPRFDAMWSRHLSLDPDLHFLQKSFAALSDGRIAVGGGRWGGAEGPNNGVLWVEWHGEQKDWSFGPDDQPGYNPLGVRRGADDSVVALGFDILDGQHLMRITRVPSDGSPATVVDADLRHVAWPADFEVLGDSVVIIGRGPELDAPPFELWVARVDLATGALEWEVELPSVHPVVGLHVAVGPNGEILAAHGEAGDQDEFKVWRLGDDGSVLWTADLLDPPVRFNELIDLVVTPGEQAVAIVQHVWPAEVTAHAIGLADGEARWHTQVAIEDDSGSPGFGAALVDPDGLSLPIGRGPTPYFKGESADPLTVSLVRLGFDGAILEDTPLTLPDFTAGSRTLMPARGKCGDLLLLHVNGGETAKHHLWSFAP
ncbi:hypothetical protein OV203_19925 [Nannocystis sp. ILAH1]|uniref:hypothetical protein n=1 Tax=Nannocystis sp. ILAH1 TaxID=2996789 RepID=UPI00226FB177|nr:hypothetical protein [Nannocystis sp. ILAH1]MCY0989419.1 hypothetical protein [Nannocystis sp. ILAH1]